MHLLRNDPDKICHDGQTVSRKLLPQAEDKGRKTHAPSVGREQKILKENHMGFLKTGLKLVGTAALVATGTASTVLKGVADAAGIEIGSELFGATKDASFDGIRSIWNSEACDEAVDRGEEISANAEDAARRKMADTAYRAAQIAKKNGDEEAYERYMEKYYEYR